MRTDFTRRRAATARAIGVCALACAWMAVAQAQPRHPNPPGRAPGWHGKIERFHEHDWQLWRNGRWYHGRHGGRVGWWWIVRGVWYSYPTPVYPYPNPWEPPPAEYVMPPTGSPPPPTQYWYYCEGAKGYYPYVPTCPGGWSQVPATPQQ